MRWSERAPIMIVSLFRAFFAVSLMHVSYGDAPRCSPSWQERTAYIPKPGEPWFNFSSLPSDSDTF